MAKRESESVSRWPGPAGIQLAEVTFTVSVRCPKRGIERKMATGMRAEAYDLVWCDGWVWARSRLAGPDVMAYSPGVVAWVVLAQ